MSENSVTMPIENGVNVNCPIDGENPPPPAAVSPFNKGDGSTHVDSSLDEENPPPASPVSSFDKGDCDNANEPKCIQIKYNHQLINLDLEKARELAQKGMNYDKVYSKLMELGGKFEENPPQSEQKDINPLGNPPPASQVSPFSKGDGCSPISVEDELKAQVDELFRAYPDVKSEDITPDLFEKFNSGVKLVAAYELSQALKEAENLKAKVGELTEKIKTLETGRENRETAVGSVLGGGQSVPDEIYSKEEFDVLTKEQVKQNLPKALKSMSFWSARK